MQFSSITSFQSLNTTFSSWLKSLTRGQNNYILCCYIPISLLLYWTGYMNIYVKNHIFNPKFKHDTRIELCSISNVIEHFFPCSMHITRHVECVVCLSQSLARPIRSQQPAWKRWRDRYVTATYLQLCALHTADDRQINSTPTIQLPYPTIDLVTICHSKVDACNFFFLWKKH